MEPVIDGALTKAPVAGESRTGESPVERIMRQ